MFAILVVTGAALAQPTGTVVMTAEVAQTPLAVAAGDFDADGLIAGQCYKIPADVQNPVAYSPVNNTNLGNVSITLDETVVSGDPLAFVVCTFAMPTIMSATSAGPGIVHCTYDNLSAAWGISGAEASFFNPQTDNPKTFQLDASGALNIVLSANLCVDRMRRRIPMKVMRLLQCSTPGSRRKTDFRRNTSIISPIGSFI